MVDIMADPERAWQTAMRVYFKEVDYHGLGQIFRKWNVRGTENQNGTWIDWNQVPDNCQKDVKSYVQKVVESRRKQKEWEDFVRRESIERSVNPDGNPQETPSNDLDEKSLTFEERELAAKTENWNKKNYSKRASSSTVDEVNPSQWVLDRVPYSLAQQQQQQTQADDNSLANITRWKKVGNLSHLILRDTHLRWVDEEYDPNYYAHEKDWRIQEERWWKNEDGTVRRPTNEENSRVDTYEAQRVNRANRWMSNRNKLSAPTQKTLRKFRDFLRQQTSRNNFLICPASWAKNRQEIPEEGTYEMDDELWVEEDIVDGTEEDDKEWNMDEEEEEQVNPWNRTTEGEEEKPVVKKKKAKGKKKAVAKTESVFESGTAVAKPVEVSKSQPVRKSRKKASS